MSAYALPKLAGLNTKRHGLCCCKCCCNDAHELHAATAICMASCSSRVGPSHEPWARGLGLAGLLTCLPRFHP